MLEEGVRAAWSKNKENRKTVDTIIVAVSSVGIAYAQEMIRQPFEWYIPPPLKKKIHSLLGHKGYYVVSVIARDVLRLGIRTALYHIMKKRLRFFK